ncbi:MAG: hypothetical protein EOO53_19790 [Gammaproteobacteria bacterium]|nr:MAG: hypothetical protein EOO53_19790 [Gammaproteobacteria bacterium]
MKFANVELLFTWPNKVLATLFTLLLIPNATEGLIPSLTARIAVESVKDVTLCCNRVTSQAGKGGTFVP